MSLNQNIVSVGSSATLVSLPKSQEPDQMQTLTISIQNTDTAANIYVGNSSVTNSSYGIKLVPGDVISLTVNPFEFIYAVSDAVLGYSNVAILEIIR